MSESLTKRKITKAEAIWIVIYSLLMLAGLFFIIFGFVADYLPVKDSDNYLGQAAFTSAMHMSYRWFGVILLLGGVAIALISLNYFAHKSDVEEERAIRKAERLKVISDTAPENVSTEGAVDAAETPLAPSEE